MTKYFYLLFLPAISIQSIHAEEPQSLDEPSADLAPHVDRSTLIGKVMVGYQGWFNCEGDGAGLGWIHWSRKRRQIPAPHNVTVDLWPDMTELDKDEHFATGFQHEDGSTAHVFSSGNRKTVLRHFRWMREYGIDGAFLQRFANGLTNASEKRHKDNVLSHVREGAKSNGRSFAVMYDLSGLPKGGTDIVWKDWEFLTQEQRVTENTAYQHHNGKPVVAIWGIGFSDKKKPREYTLAECRELVELLKRNGCTVMLGVPTGWRDLDRDAISDPELHEVVKIADLVSPWTPGRYRDLKGVKRHADKSWRADVKWCRDHKLDYMPVVFPGFSWHNMKGDKIDAIPRLKGDFLWAQITAARRAGCNMLYVAMFDEVDEGTAIFKCTNNPPTGNGAKFLTYEGLPSDHYLNLTGRAGKLFRGELQSEAR